MSGPQVAGVIACLAEQEPFLTQAEAPTFEGECFSRSWNH